MKQYKILDVSVDELTYQEIIKKLNESNSRVIISSVNPEITLKCESDKILRDFINNSDFRIADGAGIVFAVKKIYKKNIDRITGIDLMTEIIKNYANKKVFLYGAKPKVAEQVKELLNKKYNSLIVGTVDGYEKDQNKIINEINDSRAEILFVGLGCPKQEYWIYENQYKLENVKLLMGVGGSFDVLSGNVKRAPVIIQKINLEWLYRLIKQPKRIFRQTALAKYVIKIYRFKR
ncbi:MAG: WecB/TagA/CpsF family glycosyltransferase [Bacilli bacterium]